MNIVLNDKYRITSDKHNLILQEKKKPNKNHHMTKNLNEIRWIDVGYYGNYSHLVEALLQKEIKDSEATSLIELEKTIVAGVREISSKLEVQHD